MATSTTTIRTTRNTFVWCAPESDDRGVYDFKAVYDGYRACRRRKRGTANAQRYELRLLDHLVDTAHALQERTYAPSRSLCFVARQPKAREIHAADFRDRVIHHVLVPRLEALFEPVFIHDLYSNRQGKGTHGAVERLASFMRAWEQQIQRFLTDELQLTLKPERRLRPVTDGADFLGYIVRPHYRLVRRRVVGSLREKLAAFERAYVGAVSLRLPPEPRDQLRAVLASYVGHFAHANAHRLVQRLFAERPWLGELFSLGDWSSRAGWGEPSEPEHCAGAGAGVRSSIQPPVAPVRASQRPSSGIGIRPRWQPPAVTSLRSQVAWFREAFAPALVLVQVGNHVALFGADRDRALGVAPWMGRWSARRAENRRGLGDGISWPLSHVKGIGKSLRKADQPYVFIAEEGVLPGGMKRRVLRYLYFGSDARGIQPNGGAHRFERCSGS